MTGRSKSLMRETAEMTTTEFWNRLDALAASKDTSNSMLEVAALLREAGELPLLIACRRTPGRIHHLYTIFDERSPDITGNRYLICFTSEKQAGKKPAPPLVISDTHDQGPVFEEDSEPQKKRRKKKAANAWNATEAGEVAKVSVKKILNHMRRSTAVGGLIFNPYDAKHSMAIAKFLIEQ